MNPTPTSFTNLSFLRMMPMPRLRGHFLPALRVVLLCCAAASLTACFETDAIKQARLEKETREAELSAERWRTAKTVVLWSVAVLILGKFSYSIYEHYSKANVTRRLLEQKRDYAGALRVELKDGDYLGVEQIIKGLKLPGSLQLSFNRTANSLSKVGHLFTDRRNTFIPDSLKSQVMASTHQTYEGLFSTIQRVMVLQESHFAKNVDQQLLAKMAADVDGIHQRLEKCLREVGNLILLNPNADSRTKEGLTGMEGILVALKEADRMLNA